MATNFCSQCGTKLEEGAAFCHECGHDVTRRTGPQEPHGGTPGSPGPPTMAPMMMPPGQPWGMPTFFGGEPPVREVGHERALSAIGGIVMLFTAGLVLILGMIYIFDLAWEWSDDQWVEDMVFQWGFGLVGILMIASCGMGVAGAIGAFTLRRFKLTLMGASMLMASSLGIVELWDAWAWTYIPVLGAIGLACILMARGSFVQTDPFAIGGTSAAWKDGYGREGTVP